VDRFEEPLRRRDTPVLRNFWALLLAAYVVIALVQSSPTQPAFWVILIVGALLAAPHLGYRWRELRMVRSVAFVIGIPIGIAFIVSTPGDLAFWVVLLCTYFVVAPGYLVSLMFLQQVRPPPGAVPDESQDA
jgi:hypothetical protein